MTKCGTPQPIPTWLTGMAPARSPWARHAARKPCRSNSPSTRNPHTPLLGIVSRLAMQKGFDLLEKALPAFLEQAAQLVVLGDGDKAYRDILLKLKRQYPQHMGLHLGQSEVLAHQIEAGADIFLMPSQYEPCGLNQLYSLKYGTIPLVRATGGLVDTVTDATPQSLADGTATGFRFVKPIFARKQPGGGDRAAAWQCIATSRQPMAAPTAANGHAAWIGPG